MNCHFFGVLFGKKNVGECVNKKNKVFLCLYVFHISNFDCNFGVTLSTPTR